MHVRKGDLKLRVTPALTTDPGTDMAVSVAWKSHPEILLVSFTTPMSIGTSLLAAGRTSFCHGQLVALLDTSRREWLRAKVQGVESSSTIHCTSYADEDLGPLGCCDGD